jgi:hypothetical protein
MKQEAIQTKAISWIASVFDLAMTSCFDLAMTSCFDLAMTMKRAFPVNNAGIYPGGDGTPLSPNAVRRCPGRSVIPAGRHLL